MWKRIKMAFSKLFKRIKKVKRRSKLASKLSKKIKKFKQKKKDHYEKIINYKISLLKKLLFENPKNIKRRKKKIEKKQGAKKEIVILGQSDASLKTGVNVENESVQSKDLQQNKVEVPKESDQPTAINSQPLS